MNMKQSDKRTNFISKKQFVLYSLCSLFFLSITVGCTDQSTYVEEKVENNDFTQSYSKC